MLANKLRGISRSTGGGDQTFTSSGTFTVPPGVTSINIAAVPGATTSSLKDVNNNVILSTTIGATSSTFTSNGNTTIPVGVTSVSLTGKGGDPQSYPVQYSYYDLTFNRSTYTVSGTPVNVPPTNLSAGYLGPPPGSISVTNHIGRTANIPLVGYNPSNGSAQYTGNAYTIFGDGTTQNASMDVFYQRRDVSTTGTTSGTNTSANLNSANYNFSGVGSGIAPTVTQTASLPGTSALTLSWSIGTTNGSFRYSYPSYAMNQTSQMTGSSTYNIMGNIVAGGPYTGGIAAWRNNFAVAAGQVYTITISSGGAVRVMWGAGRSFPSNAA